MPIREGQDGKDYNGWKAYGQSKTAGLLFTFDLGQKLARNGVPVLAVHPGGRPPFSASLR